MYKILGLMLCFFLVGCDDKSTKKDAFFSGDVVEKPTFDAKWNTISFKPANIITYKDHAKNSYTDVSPETLGRLPADQHKLLLFFTDSPVGAHYIPILADSIVMGPDGQIVATPNKKQNVLSFLEMGLLVHHDPVPYFTLVTFDPKADKIAENFVLTSSEVRLEQDKRQVGRFFMTFDSATKIDQIPYDLDRGRKIFDEPLPVESFIRFWRGNGTFKKNPPAGNIFVVNPETGKKVLLAVRILQAMYIDQKLVLSCELLHDNAVHGADVSADIIKTWADKVMKNLVMFVDEN